MISVFERDNFLWDAQASFRPEQDCVGQVGALIEINQRWTTKSRVVKNQRRLVGDELKAFAKSTKTGWRRVEGVCVLH